MALNPLGVLVPEGSQERGSQKGIVTSVSICMTIPSRPPQTQGSRGYGSGSSPTAFFGNSLTEAPCNMLMVRCPFLSTVQAHAFYVLCCGELLRRGRGRCAQSYLEDSKTRDAYRVRLLKQTFHLLHHFCQYSLCVGFLCCCVVLNELCQFIKLNDIKHLGTCVPLALMCRG